jgi:flagellar FliL protein
MKKKLIILLLIVLIQAGISYFIITKYLENPIPITKFNSFFENDEEPDPKANVGEIFMVEDLVINPCDTKGRRFVALSLGLETTKEITADDLKKRKPQICDAVISTLIRKKLDEFVQIDNRDSLRQEIYDAVAEALPENSITNLYITKFILQ